MPRIYKRYCNNCGQYYKGQVLIEIIGLNIF